METVQNRKMDRAAARGSVVKRLLALVGFAAAATTVAGCAVSYADTIAGAGASPVHRASGSVFSPIIGVKTSEVTSAFPSTTTAEVLDAAFLPAVDGSITGNLAELSRDAAWSLTLGKDIEGMRLGPMYGAETVAPFQVGDVMLVGMRSSVLNGAGTAAFSMRDGSLLWQDRSLECQRVDLGGALPCRQNSGEWAPFNPHAAAFGPSIHPGFAPEVFGYADGVLYSARNTGAGEIEVAAGTVEDPAKLWTVAIPRAEVTLQPGGESYIEVGENIRVVMGSAEVRLTKDGYTFTDEAQPVLKQEKAEAKVSRTIGGVKVSNSTPDVLEAAGTASWQIPSRVASAYSVTDGAHLTFVAGDEADGTNVIRTVSLADGHVISEHSVVAGAAQPREIQSAAHGIFAYDKQFSTIAYYPAG